MKNFTILLSVTSMLLTLTACRESTRISTQAAGHPITIEIEGNRSLEVGPKQALIVGEYGRITIEPARVQFGNGPWTRIPEAVPMTVSISKHECYLRAAGVSVKETSR